MSERLGNEMEGKQKGGGKREGWKGGIIVIDNKQSLSLT